MKGPIRKFSDEQLLELATLDNAVLETARGYYGLKLFNEAATELSRASRFAATRDDFLEIRSLIHGAKGQWRESLACADAMIEQTLDNATAHCLKAEAVKHLNGVESAYQVLMDALWRFPKSALANFNLSCFAAKAGNLRKARRHLIKCFRDAVNTDNDGFFQSLAVFDEDLRAIWSEIPRMNEVARRLYQLRRRNYSSATC